MLTPSFSPYITNYTIALGKNDPVPTVTAAETVNEFAAADITQATESTMQAIVTVTAENGVSKTVYTVNMDKEDLDIYGRNNVSPHDLAYLDAISDWDAPEYVYDTAGRLDELDGKQDFHF